MILFSIYVWIPSSSENSDNRINLQLSGVSNSDKEIFQTYIQGKNIGIGFEREEEAMHYLNSTELISDGSIFKLQ